MAKKTTKGAPKPRFQIAALPVMAAADGTLRVLLITSRETRRWVIPKGWPMKGFKDHRAAAQEALEEAGVVGEVRKRPIGSYAYWKRHADHFELCEVRVYLLPVARQLDTWREKDQREAHWFTVEEAGDRVEEPGLVALLRGLGSGGGP